MSLYAYSLLSIAAPSHYHNPNTELAVLHSMT